MTTLTITEREGHPEQPISGDVSVARGLLDREHLLEHAGSRRDQAGDGHLGAAGKWEDLAVACVG